MLFNTPKTKIFLSCGLLGTMLSLPFVSLAAPRAYAQTDTFCASLPSLEQKMISEVSARKSAFDARETARLASLANRRQDLAGKFMTERDTADASRVLMYGKIDALAGTPEKTAAAAEFKAVLDNALLARRDSVDAAVAAYEESLASFVKSKFDATNKAIDEYGTTLETAFLTAKNSCAIGTDPKAVRTTLKKSVMDARTVFKNTVGGDNVKASIEAFAAARKTAIDNSIKLYQTTLASAKTKLELSLK